MTEYKLRHTLEHKFQQVVDAIGSEIEYALQQWDDDRPSLSLKDPDKPLECWIMWTELELQKAKDAAYHSYGKEPATSYIRKATTHLIRAMMYYGVEQRK